MWGEMWDVGWSVGCGVCGAQATWREERERMVSGYKEAMELRDTALHQASCANAAEQKLRAQVLVLVAPLRVPVPVAPPAALARARVVCWQLANVPGACMGMRLCKGVLTRVR